MRTILMGFALLLAAAPAVAQGWIEPPRHLPNGTVTKLRTAVHVTITGRIAQVEVEEWFRNDGHGLGEGDYLYPLPGEAVFSNFSLFQGDRELRGETMDATEARSIYEEIVRRRRDPALIELVGHGIIRSRIFPINPGETRKITLRYTQLMNRAGDALQFRYAAGSRNIARLTARSPHLAHGPIGADSVPLTFVLEAEAGDRFRDPFSPTHRVRVEREDGHLRVRPEEELRGNFALFLPLARGAIGVTVATHKPSTEPGYFMLTLSPGEATDAVEPRDVTVVLDVSGSMSGEKLGQAKAALRQLLGSLDGRDRFRLIAFNNAITTHRAAWSSASHDEVAAARRWIDALAADGGTNISGALQEAFRLPSPDGRVPFVLFLTDGIPSVGERDPERIALGAEAARGRARVFAFGVGYDVNTFLLDRLTAAGRGATEYIGPAEDVEQAVSALATKIRHPVLIDLALDDTPVRFSEIHPVRLPDLFAGEELIIFGRYDAIGDDRSGTLRLSGRRSGRVERFATDVTFPTHALANDYIPRLWASRKLGHLARQIRIEGHSADLERQIRDTALRYGLLSEYTSYLVQEPEIVALRSMPHPVRHGAGGGQANQSRLRAQMMLAVGNVASPDPTAALARAVTGRGAVERAERDRARREVVRTADLVALDEHAAGPTETDARIVAGRWFTLQDSVWVDHAHSDSLPVVEIELYSKTYFELLRYLPELERWLTTMERVLVAGSRTSIKTVTTPATPVTGVALGRLVREFRGS